MALHMIFALYHHHLNLSCIIIIRMANDYCSRRNNANGRSWRLTYIDTLETHTHLLNTTHQILRLLRRCCSLCAATAFGTDSLLCIHIYMYIASSYLAEAVPQPQAESIEQFNTEYSFKFRKNLFSLLGQ